MFFALVVRVCHMITTISSPVCHEEIVQRTQTTLMACVMSSQQVIADWKSKSIYQDDQWITTEVFCNPGDYQPKDMI